MKKSLPDILVSIGLIAILSVFASQMPSVAADARSYPIIIMGLGYVLSIALLIRSVNRYRREKKEEKTDLKQQIITVLIYIVMIAVYLYLISFCGYIIATVVFMIASLLYLRLPSKIIIILLSVITTVVLYLVFTRILNVTLPRGNFIQFYF